MTTNSVNATRRLFGGAISCEIPTEFADVSSFRQVPDNQEVFANAHTDQCVIIELLQYEESVPDNESGRFFFNEIARSNACAPEDVSIFHEEVLPEADMPRIDAQQPQPKRPSKCIAVGDQRVAKFKEGAHAKNTVRVYIGNIRLPSVETDVVISVSVPLQINPASSSHESFVLANSEELGAALFKQVLQSFQVHDWNLFG